MSHHRRIVLGLIAFALSAGLTNDPVFGRSPDSDLHRSAVRPGLSAEPTLMLRTVADSLVEAAASSTSLYLSIESRGMSAVSVAPGEQVNYEVVGVLSDDANEGLGLIGLDLVFDGGDLPHANIPIGEPTPGCDNPMINFTRPWGLTNPDSPCPLACGFGGTIIDGDLVQVGGGQNTINNGVLPCIDSFDCPTNSDCEDGTCAPVAEFPIGPVLTGVAQPGGCGPAVLVTGAFTAPASPGVYTLAIESPFANVIREGETGDVFWATEAAGIEFAAPLVVTVAEMISASVDVRPNGNLAPLDRRSHGVLDVAVAGGDSLDVTRIEIGSVVLFRADGVGDYVSATSRQPPTARLRRVTPAPGGDGFAPPPRGMELVIRFMTADVVRGCLLDDLDPGATVELSLRGLLSDGRLVEGSDLVQIKARLTPHPVTVSRNASR